MLTPFANTGLRASLLAIVVGVLIWAALGLRPTHVRAVIAPAAAECPCQRPRIELAVAHAPEVESGATEMPVSRQDRFLGRTAELRDWHRAGRPGDLGADLRAATLAIRNLGAVAPVTDAGDTDAPTATRGAAVAARHAS